MNEQQEADLRHGLRTIAKLAKDGAGDPRDILTIIQDVAENVLANTILSCTKCPGCGENLTAESIADAEAKQQHGPPYVCADCRGNEEQAWSRETQT